MLFTDILVKNGLIGQGKLAKVITQSEETGIALEKALKAEGISGDDILNAKSKISGLAIKKVSKGQVLFDTLKKIIDTVLSETNSFYCPHIISIGTCKQLYGKHSRATHQSPGCTHRPWTSGEKSFHSL